MDKHVIELNEQEWKEYVLENVHKIVSSERGMRHSLYDHFTKQLRIIKIENGVAQLGFAPPEYKYEDQAKDLMFSYGDQLNAAFSTVLKENCRVEILPIVVE